MNGLADAVASAVALQLRAVRLSARTAPTTLVALLRRDAPMLRLALASLLLLAAGCSSVPEVVHLTPRFTRGAQRLEHLEHFVQLAAPADLELHSGIAWRATVEEAGPGGARISCQVTRVVAKLPGVPSFDSEGGLLGRLVGATEALRKLVGGRFSYTVDPAGEVTVTGWDAALKGAEGAAGAPLPLGIPSEAQVATTLARVYGPQLPRREVRLGERWEVQDSLAVGTARANLADAVRYDGLGELTRPFGGDDLEAEGLAVRIAGKADVVVAGRCFLGDLGLQVGDSGGTIIVSTDGAQVLGYRRAVGLKLVPAEGLFSLGLLQAVLASQLLDLDWGWSFMADPWE